MFNFTKREQVIISIAFILLIALVGTYMLHYNKEEPIALVNQDSKKIEQENETIAQEQESENQLAPNPPEKKMIYVDLKGQVHNPGVIILEEGQRVIDAINKAGGLIEETADVNTVNLAAVLVDGQVVYVPSKEENLDQKGSSTANVGISQNSVSTGKINLNTATEAELDTLPGIGPSTAKKIIEYREQNNRFTAIEDILNISGIGEKKFEQIKELIEVR